MIVGLRPGMHPQKNMEPYSFLVLIYKQLKMFQKYSAHNSWLQSVLHTSHLHRKIDELLRDIRSRVQRSVEPHKGFQYNQEGFVSTILKDTNVQGEYKPVHKTVEHDNNKFNVNQ